MEWQEEFFLIVLVCSGKSENASSVCLLFLKDEQFKVMTMLVEACLALLPVMVDPFKKQLS